MICNEWTVEGVCSDTERNRKVSEVLRTGKLVTKTQMLTVPFSDLASNLQKAIPCNLNTVNKVKAVAVSQ